MTSRQRLLAHYDPLTRRALLGRLARSAFGLTVLSALEPLNGLGLFAAEPGRPRPRARACIYLYMNGGMSHLDTFDPKPGHAAAGPVKAIASNVDGLQLTENLPLLAKQADKLAVIRSLTSNQGAHEQGEYLMRTSYSMRGTIKHPTLGAWCGNLLGTANPNLPAYLTIGAGSNHPGAGFMESRFAPLPLGNPEQGLPNSTRPDGVTAEEYQHRLELLKGFNARFQHKYDVKEVRAYRDLYDDAVTLMDSKDLATFDLKREPESMRTAYGANSFGQGCLLARRLVENDVRFVEVGLGGWDTHDDNFDRVADQAAILDRGLSTLLADLTARGMLAETLVVVATEFGRSPGINQNQGRDHHPRAFSGLLAGGGISGGRVHGQTSENGGEVVNDPVLISDFNATIAQALGLPLDKVLTSPAGRPFTIADKGKPLGELFTS
jgi:hypothetical protein